MNSYRYLRKDKIMSPKEQIIKEIQPLLKSIKPVNKAVDSSEGMGYKVSLTQYPSLASYSKDFANGYNVINSPKPLINALKRVEVEIDKLSKKGYKVELSACRPNGANHLFVESVAVTVTDRDYGNWWYV